MEQLLLFEETEIAKLRREVKDLKLLVEKMRKSQYAKIGAVEKIAKENKHDLETLMHSMCRTTQNDYADLPLFAFANAI